MTTGTLLKQVLTATACAVALAGAQPAAAHGHSAHEHGMRAASGGSVNRGSHTYARTAPREAHYTRTMPYARVAPRERQYAAPHYARTAPRVQHYAAPHYARIAPRERHFARTAPFVQRVPIAPRRTVRANTAPFKQFVRVEHRRGAPRFVTNREVVRSPFMRAVYAPRTRAYAAYHPAYLAGRVVSVNREAIVLAPPVGREIIVRDAPVANAAYLFPVGQYVTMPVTYGNDGYSVYTQPAYQGYAYTPPRYCYAPSSTLYAAVLPAVIGAVSGNGNLNASDLAALALSAAAGSYGSNCSNGYQSYPAQVYASPYDNCVYSDTQGDGYCAVTPANAYSYGSAYAPQQLQGLVVAKTGTMLMVLGGNGLNPVFVNAAPALQNGYAFNGPVAVGQVVDAFGYYNGDTFVATALQ